MTTPLMKHLFSISFILIILLLASQSFQSSAHELVKSPDSTLDKEWDNSVSGHSDFHDIQVVSKKGGKKGSTVVSKKGSKTKGKKKKSSAAQKRVSPFQAFAFVGYFIFFGFLLF